MKWFSCRKIDRVRASSEDFVVATLSPPTVIVPSSTAEQAPDHGEQRGLARAVGAHERRNAARGDVERNLPDAHGGRILLDDGIDGDHRRPFRRIVTMNASPPTNSMMMETTPCVLNT